MMAAEVKHRLPNAMTQPHDAANDLCPSQRFMVDSDNILQLRRVDRELGKNDGLRSLQPECFSKSVLWGWNTVDSSKKDEFNKFVVGNKMGFGLPPPRSNSSPASGSNAKPTVLGKSNPGAPNNTTRKDGLPAAISPSPRRSIFGSFWKREDTATSSDNGDGESDTQSTTSSGHRRNKSYPTRPIPDSPCSATRKPCEIDAEGARDFINVMMFSPPVQHKSVIMSRFEGLEDLPPDIHMSLPLLPSPLSRTYRSDGSAYSGGVYPLNSARTILKKSSYGSETQEEQNNDNEQTNLDADLDALSPLNGKFRKTAKNPPPMVMPMPLAFTDSVHLNNQRRNGHGKSDKELIQEAINDAESDDTSSSQSQSTGTSTRRVHFDPRVTVTEYHDEVPRQWYTDTELDKFKFETIVLAQRFLRSRPDLALEYCKGQVNPITGVIQKKALYSLPALNDVKLEGDCSGREQTSGSPNSPISPSKPMIQYNYAELARAHVKKILVVDPNKIILDLFCRSMRQIFPHAEITPVQTGDDALRHIEQPFQGASIQSRVSRGFDLIIIEERLDAIPMRCFGQSPEPLGATRKRSEQDNLGALAKVRHSSMTQLEGCNKVPTGNYFPKLVSGSEVIGEIKRLELSRASSLMAGESRWGVGNDEQDAVWLLSLKIGVCTDQKTDTLKLWQSGADLVWGKPPPPMGENLRNLLVTMLVQKRDSSSMSTLEASRGR